MTMCIKMKHREVEGRLRKERRPKCLTQYGISALEGGFASIPQRSLGNSEGHMPEFLSSREAECLFSCIHECKAWRGHTSAGTSGSLCFCAAGREGSGRPRAGFQLVAESQEKQWTQKWPKGSEEIWVITGSSC